MLSRRRYPESKVAEQELSPENAVMRMLLGAALTVAVAGCSGISVSTYQDPKADFSAVSTWSWVETEGESSADPEISAQARLRLHNLIAAELEARGYRWTLAGQADILVEWSASLGAPLKVRRIGLRFGEPVDPAFPENTTPPQSLKEGLLAIDILAAKPQRRLVWRSIVEGIVDRSLPDEERQERLTDAVSRAMAPFPSRR
jgi:hypothetical protein